MTRMLPLALTMGEPSGISGELALKAWLTLNGRARGPHFFVLDDPEKLKSEAKRLGLTVPIVTIANASEARSIFPNALPVLPVRLAAPAKWGQLDPRNGAAVIESIDKAVALVQSGQASAVVTSPIHKAALYAAGFKHPGHTEYFASLAGNVQPVMMLAGPDLRVVPLTIHVPHREVPRLLTKELILSTARITAKALRTQFGIAKPRLALSGLNPHAGEGGSIGREEIDIMEPAIAELQREGINARGPLSADTLFHAAARKTYDVALCPTHDQALIPIKTLAFDDGVNVTLGLPFIRTSPDHGTALDIAGKGIAKPDSLLAAIRLADKLTRNKL
jgi:4-hydroxythreonine-4-phosphate dehydrogenase